MASPWIACLEDVWDEQGIHSRREAWFTPVDENLSGLESDIDGLVDVTTDTSPNWAKGIDNWVEQNPTAVISLPASRKKIVFLHSLFTNEDTVFGLKGFNSAAPVVAISKRDFVKKIVSVTKDGDIKDLVVPSFLDMLAVKENGIKEVIALEVEDLDVAKKEAALETDPARSRMSVKTFDNEPAVLTWCPGTIANTATACLTTVTVDITAEKMLETVLYKAGLAIQAGLVDGVRAAQIWERHAQSLWVMAHGIKERFKLREPQGGEEIALADEAYLARCSQLAAHMRAPIMASSGSESEGRARRRGDDGETYPSSHSSDDSDGGSGRRPPPKKKRRKKKTILAKKGHPGDYPKEDRSLPPEWRAKREKLYEMDRKNRRKRLEKQLEAQARRRRGDDLIKSPPRRSRDDEDPDESGDPGPNPGTPADERRGSGRREAGSTSRRENRSPARSDRRSDRSRDERGRGERRRGRSPPSRGRSRDSRSTPRKRDDDDRDGKRRGRGRSRNKGSRRRTGGDPSDSSPSSSSSSSDRSSSLGSEGTSESFSYSEVSESGSSRESSEGGGRSERSSRYSRSVRSRRSERRNRGRRRSSRRLTALAIRELAKSNKIQVERERTKHSALKNWAESQVTTLKLLSSSGFGERRTPKMSDFATKLCTESKNLNRAFNLLREEGEKANWDCRLSDAAITRFMSSGLGNDEIEDTPQGVSTFAFLPRTRVEQRTKKERKRQIQESFGDGKLSDEALTELADNYLHLPKDIYEAMEQLRSMISFLELLTGQKDRCIATSGFQYALSVLEKNKRRIIMAQADDSLFLVKFMYLADRCWQDFLTRLLAEADAYPRDRMRGPYENLRDHPERFMVPELGALATGGAVPQLSLPKRLAVLNRGGKAKAAGGQAAGEDMAEERAERPKVKWYGSNPEPKEAWLIPDGKKFHDYFGKRNPKNMEGFPKVKHHVSGKMARPCINYLTEGKCTRAGKCPMAHFKLRDLPEAEVDKFDKRFKEVYGG